jgi:UDPglucose 6-dehydrogenase
MKICVIGTGYVGLVTGVCLADLGNNVICVDKDISKIEKLKKGFSPIYEPGIEELISKNLKEKRLSFTDSIEYGIKKSKIIFIAVGTPPDKNGEPDMSAVWEVAKNIGKYINSYKIIINKSTVPVGSGNKVAEIIKQNMKKKINFDVISNPEFLREGSAIYDFMNPDRIVIGSNNRLPSMIIKRLYEPLKRPIIITDLKSAELIKYASNSFLATKISFINEIANLCEKVGANVEDVAKGMGLDSRIGDKFLKAGIGFGGSCFPKDTLGLFKVALKFGYKFKILKETINVNILQRKIFLEKINKFYNEKLENKQFAIWGASFKPNTDDIREAPSIDIIKYLLKKKSKIKLYDPVAIPNIQKLFDKKIKYFTDPYETIKNCDALIILTEWNEFIQIDLKKVKKLLKTPVIFDGRNIYDINYMQKLKFKYISVGRKQIL